MSFASDLVSRGRGHTQYRAWLAGIDAEVPGLGASLSPFWAVPGGIELGCWRSFSVEGFYQGSKVVRIQDPSLVDSAVLFRRLPRTDSAHSVHFPAVMAEMNVRSSLYFALLKSGRKYNAARNRHFGRRADGARNWTLKGSFVDPHCPGREIPRYQFERFYGEAYEQQLVRVSRLEWLVDCWLRGQYLLTPEMRIAHPHLVALETHICYGPRANHE